VASPAGQNGVRSRKLTGQRTTGWTRPTVTNQGYASWWSALAANALRLDFWLDRVAMLSLGEIEGYVPEVLRI
jgi:hypothetical protein